ncbi:RNA polymerase sigma factor [Limibacillus halophilus]|uniref:RNA polymerase sigma-70 factor (ECF subfamily) n=1 Tax=Limibacillus halophilus TaxID=1579333 RepID=A0A839SQ13_9PROT|nr:RNA polymerase sigma factor [Limibacillus halophilus]MBB3064542.1 RNA polymerase sigma-70 factor (ECF subfamily) [Limibacillus halophilus]
MDLRYGIKRLLPDLMAYAQSIARDRNDAEDLVGDSVERALSARRHPDNLNALRPWMFRIIRNLFLDEVRKRKVRREFSEGLGRYLIEINNQQSDTLNDTLTRLAFGKLKQPEREILFLVDVLGMKYEEAATVLDVPSGTVMSRVSRARRTLIALIDGAHIPGLNDSRKNKSE